MKNIKKDIAIIGGGIAGLYTAYKLGSMGYDTLILQDENQLCPGPSVRNGGLIHRGTFHSALVNDDDMAMRIAERCVYGYEQIKSFAPEAIEEDGLPVFALIKSDALAERAIKRWNKGNIYYKKVSYRQFNQHVPGISHTHAKYIFKTQDLPINYRILYQKLFHQSKKEGVDFIFGAKLLSIEPRNLIFEHGNTQKLSIEAKKYIFTTGYKTKKLIAQFFPNTLQVKIWKSHALSIPRPQKYGFYFIDKDEVSVEPQGIYSIVCQSQEDTLVDNTDLNVVQAKAENIFKKLLEIMPEAYKYANIYRAHACLKPSITLKNDTKRSVDAEVHVLNQKYLIALPGKATEAPFLADGLVKKVFQDYSDAIIAKRPGDTKGWL